MTRSELDTAASSLLRDDAPENSLTPSAVLELLRDFASQFSHRGDSDKLIVLSSPPTAAVGSEGQFAVVLPSGDLYGPRTQSWGPRIGNLFTGAGGRVRILPDEASLSQLVRSSLSSPDLYVCRAEVSLWLAGVPDRVVASSMMLASDATASIAGVSRHHTVLQRPSHGLTVGSWVLSLDMAYSPLSLRRAYYVAAATQDTFRLSEGPDKPVIQLAGGDHTTCWHVLPCLVRFGEGFVPDEHTVIFSTTDPNQLTTEFYPAEPQQRNRLYVSTRNLSWWLWDSDAESYVSQADRSQPPLVWVDDFTAVPASNPYAIDVSRNDSTSQLLVLLPSASVVGGQVVTVYDATAACTGTRSIAVRGVINGDERDFVLNSPAAAARFDFVGSPVGWRVSRL